MNYYDILGVSPTATADEIKRAYRRLASQHHPDKGGDTAKFQEIEQAYRVLSDADQKAAYDNPRSQNPFNFGGGAPFDFDTIFDVFGARFSPPKSHARISLWISLQELAAPGPKIISLGTARGTQTVEINLPGGINDGDSVQYSGLAPGGQDLVVTFRIKPDNNWQKQGSNLVVNLTASVWDLIVGAEVPILDIRGNKLMLTIPANTQPGTLLRVRDRGLQDRAGKNGDMLVRLNVRIPTNISADLIEAIRKEVKNK